jgi:hypothetical protein
VCLEEKMVFENYITEQVFVFDDDGFVDGLFHGQFNAYGNMNDA